MVRIFSLSSSPKSQLPRASVLFTYICVSHVHASTIIVAIVVDSSIRVPFFFKVQYYFVINLKIARSRSKAWVPLSINTMGNKYSKGRTFSRDSSNLSCLATYESLRVPFVDLEEATNNFDEKFVIGEGGFGKVYRGVLRDGTKVALKRGKPGSSQGIVEFQTEIEMLSQLSHPYLVSLIGYCNERNEMILIYEYIENGNLKSHLYGSDLPSISWKRRLEICIGAARGLHYLHTSSVIHRDVKSTNILLDENFMPKITDFGLSKKGPEPDQTRTHITTDVKGAFGYLDPEYYRRQQLTEKSDVYSFGVVLCEVLCARPALAPSLPRGQVNLAEWAMKWQRKGHLDPIIDRNLVGKVRPDSLRRFGETAEKCLADHGVDRPSMGDVLWNLEYALHLQESVIQDDPEEINTIPIGDQINYDSSSISDFSGVYASSSAAQMKTSNWDALSSDEVISP